MKPKKIETPEMMYQLFEEYKKEVKSNPFQVMDYVGKDATLVYREKEKPLTMEGFNVYLFKKGVASGVKNYFANTNNKYRKYLTICSHIREEIRQDQIAGGMSGIYNPSITQRLNNLVEKQQIEHIEQPLFGDSEEVDE